MKIEYKEIVLVDGKKLTRITTTDERWYKVGERFLPSVTYIASYYPKSTRYIKWVADQGYKEAELIKIEAGDKGSRVHNACSLALKGEEIRMDSKFSSGEDTEPKELTPEEYSCVMSFVEFLNKYQPIIMGVDYTTVNEKEGYAGTVDFKCRLNIDDYKGVWIVDIKTSKDIWPSHEIQISAYKNAEKDVTNVAILQVGYERNKTQKYKFTEVEDQFGIFLSVKNVWAKETAGIEPSQKDYPLFVKWEKANPIVKKVAKKLVKKSIKAKVAKK